MKFVCDSCATQYLISDEKVGSKGVKVRCKRCGNVILVRPHQHESDSAEQHEDLGGQTEPQGAPLPEQRGAADGEEGDELGQAFDRLLQGDLSLGEGESDEEDEEQETQIFSRDEIMRSSGALSDEDQHKIDEVFSAASATDVAAARDGTGQDGGEEWYLAINDEQVGPMDLGEVEQRWEQGEIGADTLAWFAGMSDWQPISEVPQLRYLLGVRKDEPAAPAADQPAAVAPEEQWDTSGSSELSALVEEEMQAVVQTGASAGDDEDEPGGEPESDQQLPPEEIPPWEKEDVLSGEVARPSESYFDPSLDAPTTDSGSPLTDRAGIVKPAYLAGESEAGSRRKWLWLGGAGVAAAAGVIVLLLLWPSDKPPAGAGGEPKSSAPKGQSGALASVGPGPGGPARKHATRAREGGGKPAASQGTAATGADAGASGDTAGQAGKPAGEDTLVVKKPVASPAAEKDEKVASAKPSKGTHRPGRSPRGRKPRPPRATTRKTGSGSTAPKPKQVSLAPSAPARSDLPEKLTPAQIKGVMKKYLGAMRKCVKMQKERDPSVKGTMLVAFTITGEGSTTAVKVLSAEHRGTFVDSCITTVIGNIRFPKFSGSPIRIPRVPLKLGD